MAIKLGGNIKVNLPQPGETKAQFMTRSVRILMKSGKSKSMAMGIAERIWNNIAQSSSVQSNQVDSDVTFVGQTQRQASGPSRGSVAVRQMGSFNDFSNRINESKMNAAASKSMQTSQMEFLSGLKDVITSQLISPLASIMRQQSAGPGRYVQNARNYNGMGGDSSALSNLFSQQVSLQSQTLGAINQLVSIQSNIGQELATIRSTGMKIRRLAKGPRKPRPADFWEDFESADPQLKSPFVETFMKHMQGEFPILDKIATAARVIANPIQTLRKTVGKKLRKGVAKLREMSGDIDYRFEQDPDQVKREAGLVVLDKERLADKVTSEILPQKLAELTDDNKQQIDVLRNIYDVNKQHLSFVTKGKVQHQYTRTLDTSAHIFDRETGKYFTEKEFKNQLQSRENQLRRYMKKADRIRSLDPTTGLIDFITKGMDSAHKALTGVSSYQDRDDRIKTQVNKLTMDADEAAKREEDYYQRRGTVISRNELNSARQYGPRAISEDAPGKIIGIKKDAARLNSADGPWSDPTIRQQYLDQLGDDAFRQAAFDPKNLKDHSDRYIQDGNSIYQIDRKTKKKKWLIDKANNKKYKVDEFGNKEYRYAKDYSGEHDETGKPKLTHGQFYQDDYEFSGSKKRSMNPFRMLADAYGEYRDAMSAFHEESKKHEEGLPGIVRFLTKFIPNPKAREGKDKIEKIQDPDIKKHLLKEHKSLDDKYGFKHWDTIPPKDLYENAETSSESEEKSTVTGDLDFSNLEQLKFFVINSKKIPLFTRDASRHYLMKKLEEYNGNIVNAINNINCCCDDNSNLEKTIKDGINKIDKEKNSKKPKKSKSGSKAKGTNVKDELDNEKNIREQIQRDKVQSESRNYLKKIYNLLKDWDENIFSKYKQTSDKDSDDSGNGLLGTILGTGFGLWLLNKLKKFLAHPIKTIGGIFKWIGEIPGKLITGFKTGANFVRTLPTKIAEAFKVGALKVAEAGKIISGAVIDAAKSTKSFIGKFIHEPLTNLKRGFKFGEGGAEARALGSSFSEKVGYYAGKTKHAFNQGYNKTSEFVKSGIDKIKAVPDIVKNASDNISTKSEKILRSFKGSAHEVLTDLQKGFKLGEGGAESRAVGSGFSQKAGYYAGKAKDIASVGFDKLKNLPNLISESATTVADKSKTLIDGFKGSATETLSNLKRGFKGSAHEVLTDLQKGFKLGEGGAESRAVGSGFSQKAGYYAGKMADMFKPMSESFKGIFNSVSSGFETFKTSASEFGKSIADLGKFLKTGLGEVVDSFQWAGSKIKQFGSDLLDKFKSFGTDKLQKAADFGRNIINGAKSFGANALDGAKSFGSNVLNTAKSFGNSAATHATNAFNYVSDMTKSGINSVKSFWHKIHISDSAKKLGTKVIDASKTALKEYMAKHPNMVKVGSNIKLFGGKVLAKLNPAGWVLTAAEVGMWAGEKYSNLIDNTFGEGSSELADQAMEDADNGETFQSFHTGGLIKSALNNSQNKLKEKLGLQPGEVPIIAKEGEYVLNQEDTKKYLNESETESEESAKSSYGSSNVLKQILTELKELKEQFIDFYDDFYGLQFTFYKPLMKLFIDPLDKWNGYYEFWRSLLYNKDLHTGTALGGSGSSDDSSPGILETVKNKAAEVYNNVKQGISDKVERIKQRFGINKDDQIKSAANLPTYNGTAGSAVGGAVSNATLSYKGNSPSNSNNADSQSDSTGQVTNSTQYSSAPDAINSYLSTMFKNAETSRYSQKHRTKKGYYDCSSFVARSLRDSGFNIQPDLNTGNIGHALESLGFVYHPGTIAPKSKAAQALQPGDILWRKGHVETYIGSGRTVAARSSTSKVGGGRGVGVGSNWDTYSGFYRLEKGFDENQQSDQPENNSEIAQNAENSADVAQTGNEAAQSAVEANAPSNPGKLEEIVNAAQNEPSMISENSPSGPSEESLKSSQCPLKTAASNLSSNIETPLETAQKQAATTLQPPKIPTKQSINTSLDSNNNIKQTMKSADLTSTQVSTPDISSAQQNAKSVPANNEQTKFQNGNAAYKHPEPVANTMTSGGITPMVANVTQQHRAQQESDRATDPNTDSIIDRIFANTMYNFQQSSNNYALGNNPMSPIHIA